MMKYKKPNKYYKIAIVILWATFIILFFGAINIFASEIFSIEDQNLIPKGITILDEQSVQEIAYISSDKSIYIFRNSTPQLAQLQVGDVLWLSPKVSDSYGFLRQIIYISREEPYKKGIIIHSIPWTANHPPIISGLIAQPSTLEVGQQSNLTCYAADEDEDVLFYSWMIDGGILRGNGASVTWTAPNQSGDYYISCEVTDGRGGSDTRTVQLRVVERFPLLTIQEREFIRRFGWGNNRVVRWPDGYVQVYDSTHFPRMQEVLDRWNEVIGGKVVFYLSANPQSPVKITYNPELGRKNLCYHIDTHWRNFQLYAAEIKINPDSFLCGYPQNSFALYLHSFCGIAGFNVWQGTTIDREDWQNFNLISEIMQDMIKSLYRVPPGYDINKDQ